MPSNAWIVAADMGYGHGRAAQPLRHLSPSGEIINANNYPGIPKKDLAYWNNIREWYEVISRFRSVPIIGAAVFGLIDNFHKKELKMGVIKNEKMDKLNIGCGLDYKNGWINLDYDQNIKADVYFNLEDIYTGGKLPFKDKTFDLIVMFHVLEHLSCPLPILNEVKRVCKVGGFIEIKVPCGRWVWDGLDHKREFGYNSFNVSNFYNLHNFTKEVELIFRKRYILPSRLKIISFFKFFFKYNLHVKYKRLI